MSSSAQSQLDRINAAGSFKNSLPTLSTNAMIIGHKYVIKAIKVLQTRYGRSVLIETADYSIWLPRRIVSVITDEWISQYKPKSLALVCREILQGEKSNPIPKLEMVEA